MIWYEEGAYGFDVQWACSLSASVDRNKTVILNWIPPQNIDFENRLLVLRSGSRDGFWGVHSLDYQVIADLPPTATTIQDLLIAQDDTQYYYIVVSVNSTSGELGSSSYSIGIWTKGYEKGYDTLSVPLKLDIDRKVDWYCDSISESWGINYFDANEDRWIWHKKAMPEDVYDREIVITRGYQISTISETSYSFVGI
jgi:hypothetical protein